MRWRRDPHGPNSWTSYLAAHAGKLKSLDHFVLADEVARTLTPAAAVWDGWILCRDGYQLHVERTQDVEVRSDGPRVHTRTYSYHALRRSEGEPVNLFRYDNIHAHPGHSTRHHRHEYGCDGQQILPVRHVGVEGWPTLGHVMDELHEHWVAAMARLREP